SRGTHHTKCNFIEAGPPRGGHFEGTSRTIFSYLFIEQCFRHSHFYISHFLKNRYPLMLTPPNTYRPSTLSTVNLTTGFAPKTIDSTFINRRDVIFIITQTIVKLVRTCKR